MEDGRQYKEEAQRTSAEIIAARKTGKGSKSRLSVLEKLIDLAHHSNTELKVLAARNIRDFFKEFTDIEEDAINAVYDICEDSVPAVRIEGYKAITGLSRTDAKWVKRNTDVLLQLLQSEEEDEVQVIQAALVDHLEMAPSVTLSVLYDQLVPADDSMDESEREMRIKLASLVHTFMTTAARKSINKDTDNRHKKDYADALLNALPRLADADFVKAVAEHLLPLSVFTSSSTDAGDLLSIILERLQPKLGEDLASSPPSLAESWPFLELVYAMAVPNLMAPSSRIIKTYLSLTPTPVLKRLSRPDQTMVLSHVAHVLEVSERKADNLVELPLTSLPTILHGLMQLPIDLNNVRNIQTCEKMLKVLRYRQEKGWKIPTAVHDELKPLTRTTNPVLQTLLKPLSINIPGSGPIKLARSRVGSQSLPARPGAGSVGPRPASAAGPGPGPGRPGASARPAAMKRAQTDERGEPAKKARTEVSLLERMQGVSGQILSTSTPTPRNSKPPTPAATPRHTPVSAPIPSTGLSIRGAAKAPPPPPAPTPPPTLLTRLSGGALGGGGGGGGRDGASGSAGGGRGRGRGNGNGNGRRGGRW